MLSATFHSTDGTSTWSVAFDENCEYVEEYGRPIYTMIELSGGTAPVEVSKNDRITIIYSGSRWLAMKKENAINLTREELQTLRQVTGLQVIFLDRNNQLNCFGFC